MQMQKALKVVVMNKYIFLIAIILLGINGYAQEKKDDYLLINKVVNSLLNDTDSIVYIHEVGVFNHDDLNGYYRFKYYDEIRFKIYQYNKELNTVIKLSDEKLLAINEGKYKKFDIALDSVLKQDDYQFIFEQKGEIKWKYKKISHKDANRIRMFSDFGNRISKPVYRKDGKIAILWYKPSLGQGKFIIYRKENDIWEKISEILNVF